MLVADDRQPVAAFGPAQQAADEARAVTSENPRCPHHERGRQRIQHGAFACIFGGAVDTGRPGRVAFAIGAIQPPVENAVGRDMDQRQLGSGAGFGQRGRTIPVQGEGRKRLAFRLVDRRIGGRIDDDGRTVPIEKAFDRIRLRQIEVQSPRGNHVVAATFGKRCGQLAGAPQHQNGWLAHAACRPPAAGAEPAAGVARGMREW